MYNRNGGIDFTQSIKNSHPRSVLPLFGAESKASGRRVLFMKSIPSTRRMLLSDCDATDLRLSDAHSHVS